MRARRFQGSTISEAYEQVRSTLGDDAVIISTRNATTPGMLGFGAREFVEVVAGLPDDTELARDVPLRSLEQDIAAHELVRGVAEQAAARPLDAPEEDLAPPFVNALAGTGRPGPFDAVGRTQAGPGVQPPAPAAVAPAVPPAALDRALLANLAAGLQEVRALLDRLTRERTLGAPSASVPAHLAALHDQLAAQDVRASVAADLMEKLGTSVTGRASEDTVRKAAKSALTALLPAPVAFDLTTQTGTIFLVGPSGAGKTTAAVRLGMELTKLGRRVTVAGTDVDRAGAPQQLQAFGTAAGLRVESCYTPAEVQALIAQGTSDVVIVDTVGHNGTRTDRMAELGAYVQAIRERTVLLALPATMQAEDLSRLTSAFAAIHPDGLLLTRCDETETFGGLLSAVALGGIGVAYTTHGELVGEPARPGDNDALAGAVLTGRWPAPAAAPARRRRAGSREGA